MPNDYPMVVIFPISRLAVFFLFRDLVSEGRSKARDQRSLTNRLRLSHPHTLRWSLTPCGPKEVSCQGVRERSVNVGCVEPKAPEGWLVL